MFDETCCYVGLIPNQTESIKRGFLKNFKIDKNKFIITSYPNLVTDTRGIEIKNYFLDDYFLIRENYIKEHVFNYLNSINAKNVYVCSSIVDPIFNYTNKITFN